VARRLSARSPVRAAETPAVLPTVAPLAPSHQHPGPCGITILSIRPCVPETRRATKALQVAGCLPSPSRPAAPALLGRHGQITRRAECGSLRQGLSPGGRSWRERSRVHCRVGFLSRRRRSRILMPPKCPSISDVMIFSNDARFAAQVSCFFTAPGHYLPIIDGPRLQRNDREAEVIRRTNAAARAKAAITQPRITPKANA
jgi:hypothetical protein